LMTFWWSTLLLRVSGVKWREGEIVGCGGRGGV
jgi:hypothetical protein